MSKGAPRYVCLHGHFYQPPRENPWLETIEHQESAYPFPNWNERILDECYRPNAASRIVDPHGRIVLIANNYSKISFNFGPTLLSWLEDEAPDVYKGIIEADRLSQKSFGGHGSAMAQAYNHMIMPLANRRDKETQIIWGIRDFQYHFGHAPEGMWLPETAVDYETLDLMAEHGIKFTVLAPGQARRIRRLGGDGEWSDVSGARIDPGRTYRARMSSGRTIDLFFYDGPISSAVAFERLLSSGERFAERLVSRGPVAEPLLMHIATDGETYGHHHRHGDMALAYALFHIEQHRPEELINYGQFRELHPARYEVDIFENTAWSCAHGVGRWKEDCGCNAGHPDWNQKWRKPLRESLDWLRDRLAEIFVLHAEPLFVDPWAARNDYIEAVNDRSRKRVDGFLRVHAREPLDEERELRALQLLEMQRHAMFMYTSCGWFFDDISGVEAVQILQYAARAAELAQLISGRELEPELVDRLAMARSNISAMGDGRRVYNELVLPTKVDLRRVIAHYAVSSLFEDNRKCRQIYCYDVEAQELDFRQAGKAKLAVGTVRATSTITRAASTLSFAALHLGDHNLTGGVRKYIGDDGEIAYRQMLTDMTEAFDRADLVAVQRQLYRHFQDVSFSLKSLFRDHQERILVKIIEAPLADAESTYNQLYSHHEPLMRYLTSFELPIPEAFKIAARFVLHLRLRRALEQDPPELQAVRTYLGQAPLVGVALRETGIDYLWQQSLERMVLHVGERPDDLASLEILTRLAELTVTHHFDVVLWRTQNECFKLRQSAWKVKERQAEGGDQDAQRWTELFRGLCKAVHIAL